MSSIHKRVQYVGAFHDQTAAAYTTQDSDFDETVDVLVGPITLHIPHVYCIGRSIRVWNAGTDGANSLGLFGGAGVTVEGLNEVLGKRYITATLVSTDGSTAATWRVNGSGAVTQPGAAPTFSAEAYQYIPISTTGDQDIVIPAGSENKFVMIFGMCDAAAAGPPVMSLQNGAGWTEEINFYNSLSSGGRKRRLIMWWQHIGGTIPVPQLRVDPIDQRAWSVFVFDGVHATTPMDVTPTQASVPAGSETLNPDPAAITTVTDNAYVMNYLHCDHEDVQGFTQPTGETLLQAEPGYKVNWVSQVAASGIVVSTAGTYDPGTWTLNVTGGDTVPTHNVHTIALRPA